MKYIVIIIILIVVYVLMSLGRTHIYRITEKFKDDEVSNDLQILGPLVMRIYFTLQMILFFLITLALIFISFII